MPRSIIRTITTAIAITALAAPLALARPADMPPAVAKAAAAEQHKQARLAADAAEFPTRPLIDRPSYPPNSRPNTTPTPAAHDSVASTTVGIGIAGALLAIGTIAGIATRTRRIGRARITA